MGEGREGEEGRRLCRLGEEREGEEGRRLCGLGERREGGEGRRLCRLGERREGGDGKTLSLTQVMDTEHAAEVHRGWPGSTCRLPAGSSDLPECGRGEGRAVFGGAEWYAGGSHTYTAAAKERVHQCGECVCGECVCGVCVVCVW